MSRRRWFELLLANQDHWLVREILHFMKRTLKRLDLGGGVLAVREYDRLWLEDAPVGRHGGTREDRLLAPVQRSDEVFTPLLLPAPPYPPP